MKNRSKTLIVGAMTAVVCIATVGILNVRAGVQRPPLEPAPQRELVSPQDRKAQLQAEVTGGLRAAAAVNGRYVTARPHGRGWEPLTLADLVNLSHVVVVGQAKSHRMVLSGDGRWVVSEYAVSVNDAIAGSNISAQIRVAMFGGRVSFDDGTMAQVDTPGFMRPFNDRTYMWFLRKSEFEKANVPWDAKPGLFELAAGPLAVYDLTAEVTRVKPSGFHTSLLGRNVWKSDFTPEEFKDEVKKVAAESRR